MALDVKVTIDLVKPAGTLGWGYPLILSKGETAVSYIECASLAEVETAGFAAAEGETPASATYAAAEIMFKQKHPPKKIAVCRLTTVSAATLEALSSESWRQLVTVGITESTDLAAIKTYINTTNNTYFAGVTASTGIATLAGANGDDHIFAVVHATESELAAAAVAAEAAGNEVGSITYKNLVLTGINAESLTSAEISAIHTAHGNAVLKKAGDVVLSEGYCTSGEYADILDAKNYIVENLEYKTQKVLNDMGKIPYDNTGIAILENVAVDVMKDAYNKGMIATDDEGVPQYTVSYALRSESSSSDIAERKYKGGHFAFTLSGAVHEVEVEGEVTVA